MSRTYRKVHETNPVKAYLSQAIDLTAEISSVEEQLSFWREKAYSLPSSSVSNIRVQTSPTEEARFVSSLENQDSLEQDLLNRHTMLNEKLQEIIQTINQYTDGTENKLLTMRYVSGLTWPEIADKLGYSIRNLGRIEARALEKIIIPDSQVA